MNQKKKKKGPPDEGRWRHRATSVLSFIVGAIFGLFIQQWFVGLLPGPHAGASISGLHATSGNAAGCTVYMFAFNTDDPVEYFYVKLQFPTTIDNYKVGFPSEAETATAGRMSMQAWEVGRDAGGHCVVVQAAVNNEVDVQSSAAGNMIAVHASKLPPRAIIMGMIAVSDSESNVKPSPGIYSEGAYEYLKLGLTVRKPLIIMNMGTSDAK
jgi:hypothetical protein